MRNEGNERERGGAGLGPLNGHKRRVEKSMRMDKAAAKLLNRQTPARWVLSPCYFLGTREGKGRA